MKSLVRSFEFVKPYWRDSVAALLLLAAVVAMDLAIPRLIQTIVDDGILKSNMQIIIRMSLIMLAASVLSMIFTVANSILSVRVAEIFSRDLREAVFLKIQSLSFGNLDRLKTGQLIIRLTSDINSVKMVVQILLRIGTRAPLLIVGSAILMVTTNARLTLHLLPVVLFMVVFIVFTLGKMQPMFLKVQKKLDHLNTVLQENLTGVRVVKAFVRNEHENERFADANSNLMDQLIKVMTYMAFIMPTLMLMVNVAVVIVIWSGGIQVINGTLTTGEIVAFTNYLMTAMMPIMILAMIIGMSAASGASAERIYEVLDSEADIKQLPNANVIGDIKGRVAFENVSFSYYQDGSELVLQNINFVAEPGETIAILGSTGAGKSTLVNLIPRFYDVREGRITVDGLDVRDLEQDSLLANIGIALQETVLFSETVRDNIRYGRPQATDEEVIAAAKAAQAHEFIVQLPDGYDSIVSERGTNLSGGQKQRIAIARALLVKPRILILDDSTSAVDVETETKIQEALDVLMKGRTSFVVAQRVSTVLNADKIIVLDRGRIAAEGRHEELLGSSPVYQEIFESQLGNGVVQYV